MPLTKELPLSTRTCALLILVAISLQLWAGDGVYSEKPAVTEVSVTNGPRMPFRRGVIGVNHLAYGGDGLGYGMILKGTHTLDPQLVGWQKEIGFGSLRYPGGCGGTHHFEWKKVAGLDGDYRVMGVVEFMDMCERSGAEPILGISAHRGTPEEAAEYVEFLNLSADAAYPWARKRAERGHPEPYGAVYFEYGNEPYHGMTCSSYKARPDVPRRLITPEEYADNYLAFRKAMKTVDPKIKLGVPLAGSGAIWDKVMLSKLSGIADFFIIHTYAQAPEREGADYLTLFTDRTDYLRRRFAETKAVIHKEAELAVTEFNTRQSQHKTLTAALVNLETLMTFAEEPRITHADYWQFVNEGFGMVRGKRGEFVKRPNAWAFQLYARYTEDVLVPSATKTGAPPAATQDSQYPEAFRGRNVAEGAVFRYRDGGTPEKTGTHYEVMADGTHKLTFLDGRPQNFYQLSTVLKDLPPGDGCVWKISYEMWVVPDGRPFGMHLDVVDGRGWNATKSAESGDDVSGINPIAVSFRYRPLKDNPGSLIVRFRSAGKGIVYMRNLRVKAVLKDVASAPAVRTQLSVAKDGSSASAVLLNRSLAEQTVRLDTKGLLAVRIESVCGEVLSGPSAYATNEDIPDNVTLKPFSAEFSDGVVTMTLPPHSTAGIEMRPEEGKQGKSELSKGQL